MSGSCARPGNSVSRSALWTRSVNSAKAGGGSGQAVMAGVLFGLDLVDACCSTMVVWAAGGVREEQPSKGPAATRARKKNDLVKLAGVQNLEGVSGVYGQRASPVLAWELSVGNESSNGYAAHLARLALMSPATIAQVEGTRCPEGVRKRCPKEGPGKSARRGCQRVGVDAKVCGLGCLPTPVVRRG